jgi:hypothetical protein
VAAGASNRRYGRQADLWPDFIHGDRTGAICADRVVGRRPTLHDMPMSQRCLGMLIVGPGELVHRYFDKT